MTRSTHEKIMPIVKVYVWPKSVESSSSKKWLSTGHAALEVEGDEGLYVSFFPRHTCPRGSKACSKWEDDHFHDKNDDHITYKHNAQHTFCFSTLDVDRIKETFQNFKENNPRWTLFGRGSGVHNAQSCSSLVFLLLVEGGFNQLLGYSTRLKVGARKWAPFGAKCAQAGLFFFPFKYAWWYRSYWNAIEAEKVIVETGANCFLSPFDSKRRATALGVREYANQILQKFNRLSWMFGCVLSHVLGRGHTITKFLGPFRTPISKYLGAGGLLALAGYAVFATLGSISNRVAISPDDVIQLCSEAEGNEEPEAIQNMPNKFFPRGLPRDFSRGDSHTLKGTGVERAFAPLESPSARVSRAGEI